MMPDEGKSKQQFIEELIALRQQVAELQGKFPTQLKELVTKDPTKLRTANERFRQEIIERKGMEAALRESEAKFRTLAETTAAAIFIYQDTQNRYVNPATEAITGYTQTELLAMKFWDIIHPDFRELVKQQGMARQQHEPVPSRYEVKILTKSGEVCWLDFTGGLIEFQGRPAVLGTAFDITARKQAEAERERLLAAEREQRLLAETLVEVVLALTAQTNLVGVMDEILRQAQRLVRYSAANIMLLQDETMRIIRCQGYESFGGAQFLANLAQSLVNFPLDAQVVQSRQPLVIPDTRQNLQWVIVPETAWIRSFIAMPICLREQVVGLLRLDSHVSGQFSWRDVERLLPLANTAAIALENARLYDQARQELAERKRAEAAILQRNWELLALQFAGAAIASSLALADVLNTVAREMTNLIGVESCAISAWDQASDTVALMIESGPAEWRAESMAEVYALADFPLIRQVLVERRAEQMTISQPDLDPAERAYMQAAKLKTLLMLPMEYQNRVVGLVEIMDGQVERTFTLEEVRLVQLVANQAANAIENAHLYSQAQQELAERRQVEAELRRVAARNQVILEAMPDSLFYFNQEGQLLDYKGVGNSGLPAGILGEQIISNNLRDLLPPDLADLAQNTIEQAADSDLMQTFEYQLPGPEGLQDFEARLVTSLPKEVLMIVRNITKRKRAEKALRESEANLRAILNNTLQTFLLVGLDYKIQAVNKNARELAKAIFGKEMKEGDSIYHVLQEEDLDGFNRNFDKALAGELVALEASIAVGNQSSWYEINLIPVLAENDQVVSICLAMTNIDERKRAVDALAESEARLLAEMQSVLVITQALVSEIDLKNLLEFIITQAEHLTNADGAAVLLLSDDGQQLEVAMPGEAWLRLRPGSRLSVQGSLAELALATGRVQTSNHASEDERNASIRALLQPIDPNSLLCAPLIVRSNKLGVLLVWSQRGQVFDTPDNRLMNLFANQAALALHNAHLHARNRQSAIEQERHRLARELHDSVTQALYSMGLAAQASLRLLGQAADSHIREPIQHIHTLSQSALTEMREQLYHLHPTVLDENLVEALTQHCNMLSKQYALKIEFKANLESLLSINQRDALYYIAKESLWNIVKHAKATHVNITLAEENDQIVISVADDGIGFDPSASIGKETMGLRNMEERARLLGGAWELQSKPGQGTSLTVRIPLYL